MAREIDTLDSSKEHLLKEGESEKGEALICPALPCCTLPIVPILLQRSLWRQSWKM